MKDDSTREKATMIMMTARKYLSSSSLGAMTKEGKGPWVKREREREREEIFTTHRGASHPKLTPEGGYSMGRRDLYCAGAISAQYKEEKRCRVIIFLYL